MSLQFQYAIFFSTVTSWSFAPNIKILCLDGAIYLAFILQWRIHIVNFWTRFPSGSKFFQFHAVFGKIYQNRMLAPPQVDVPTSGKSLIRPCLTTIFTFVAQSGGSSGADLSAALLPIAVTAGVVLLALLLFLYYICRLVSLLFQQECFPLGWVQQPSAGGWVVSAGGVSAQCGCLPRVGCLAGGGRWMPKLRLRMVKIGEY